MELDVLGLLGACSYALDCVEAELVHATNNHSKRVAYMSVCIAIQMGIEDESLQDLAACALMHDNALTQYIQEELNNNTSQIEGTINLGTHCVLGEENIKELPFNTDVTDVILYHHENADGSGAFGKKWDEVPIFSRIIHLCDILDLACCNSSVTLETWDKMNKFLSKVRGKIVDDECVDAFLKAFSKENIMSLENEVIEKYLWSKVPRKKQKLNFEQVKQIAKFFAKIVDYKSPFTSTHSIGVATDAEKLSRYMNFDENVVEKMYLAGALHDIGKVAIGNDILEKPDRLTDEEYTIMKHHAAFTYYILSDIDDFEEVRDWAAFHHERLDGTGYPFGKMVEDLNTQERIMACVDIYQALTESRPYKKGMSHKKACAILYDMAEKGWLDEDIVSNVDNCFKEDLEQ